MSADECAREIMVAMDSKEFEYIIPTRIRFLLKFRPFLPLWMIDRAREREAANLQVGE
jgi:short-subunit dehydrogenase